VAACTISTEELRERLANAEQLAKQGPVFVAESGATRFVILDPEEYRRLATPPSASSASTRDPALKKPFRSLADAFSVSGLTEADANLEFEPLNWTFPPAEFP
jgi:hypothetical protein